MAEGGKSHRKKKAGRKADKRKAAESKKKGTAGDGDARKQNPKAFIFASRGKAKLQRARTAERDQRRMHVPAVERPVEEPPPFTILVHGPPGVGKTTLIKCLIKHYTRHDIREIKGPITLVAGKSRRLTFVECPQDLHGMIDAAKYADLVLLLVDGAFGFEMETFEFLNLLQVHGFPKVMGVLTHLDGFRDVKALKKTKKALKHRFWAEIYQGAKLFYLSGVKNGRYLKREVHNLARFISVMKFRPLAWRQTHPYLVTDRFEDVTPGEAIRAEPRCDRDVALYGYVRGTNWKQGSVAHIAGVGDFKVSEISAMPEPCPLPSQLKRRSLNEKERLLYAPMSDVGGLLFDRDAMYVDIPEWKMQYSTATVGGAEEGGEGEAMVRGLQGTRLAIDEKLERAKIRMFAGGEELTGGDYLINDTSRGTGVAEESDYSDGDDFSEEGGVEESDGDDSDDEDEIPASNGRHSQDLVHTTDGRVRRRANFLLADDNRKDTEAFAYDDDENDSDNDISSSEDEEHIEDDEGLGNAAKWKASIVDRAAALFSARAADLQDYIYGTRATADAAIKGPQGRNSDSDDELFRPRNPENQKSSGGGNDFSSQNADPNAFIDALDCSRSILPTDVASRWAEPGATEALRNRFVTGDWEAGAARAAARPEGGENSEDVNEDDEVYGDFEDVETGQRFEGSADPATRAAAAAIRAAEAEEQGNLAARKAAKKAAFNSEYDEGGGSKGVRDSLAGEEKKGRGKAEEPDEGETYYDAMKREMEERALRTKAAMDALDPVQRVAMEGHRPGTYVRLRFSGVPCELVQHFDPRQPILVGGLGQAEETPGYMQLRLKRHRWFPKILKNRDPLVFSIGWRRFQSLPVYAIKDNNERHRMLKYTPEHMHCLAAIWGPMAPPGTGVLAIQSTASNAAHWRVAATGVVLQLDASLRVVKKLKLVGSPFKIHRHTAFVNGMFNSMLEASKFEGASIRTVSGIRGTIKKAVRAGTQPGARDGAYRATFEDKPLLSDVVFLRAWVQVEIPKFFSPVTNLLAPVTRSLKRQPKRTKKEASLEQDLTTVQAVGTEPLEDGAPASTAMTMDFIPAPKFTGMRPGYVFTTGPQGTGYYTDVRNARKAASMKVMEHGTAVASSGPLGPALDSKEPPGWVGVRTVADLRREAGVGAPRNSDSLYRPIERKPRVFNPLRIPASLQAALPFKTKPKLESKRKRKTLEQRRAVVVEPGERKAMSLVAQLNAIRNAKAELRREQKAKYAARAAKKAEAEEAWRAAYNREERKKRYVQQGHEEKRKAKKARGA